jgi:hypothetical protein
MIWLLQNVVFSISLIVILHYLYIYFKSTLTSPKVKDLIYCPKQKYETIFNTIERGNRDSTTDITSIVPEGTSSLGIPTSQFTNNDDGFSHNNSQFIPSYTNGGVYNNNSNIRQNITVDGGVNTDVNNVVSANHMKSELKEYLKTLGLKKQSSTINTHSRSSSLSNRGS